MTYRRFTVLLLDVYASHAGFPTAMPCHTSRASDTGFFLHHFPAADADATRR